MFELKPHPDSAPGAVRRIGVEAARTEHGQFVVHFALDATLDDLVLPEPLPFAAREDRLWETTCFEAFVRPVGDARYLELNLAPSTAWAAYAFLGHRAGMDTADLDPPPIDVERRPEGVDLYAAVDVGPIVWLDPEGAWAVGLSAVIEEKDGSKSYWALAHPDGPPDFHHDACFAATLPPFEPE